MRDAQLLRDRIVALAWAPALAMACSSPSPSSPGPTPRAEPSDPNASPVSHPGPHTEDPAPTSAPPDPRVEALAADARRFRPIDGDPPYIDGFHPEEKGCTSGNWCGALEAALAISPKAEVTHEVLGCPTRISGSVPDASIEGPQYEGLSSRRNMQGNLNAHGTELHRASGSPEICCYHWFEYCSGRPLLGGDEASPRTAALRPGSGWDGAPAPQPGPEPPARIRAELQRGWTDDALAEHASVASFSRLMLELVALAAPADLLERVSRATLDEIDHTRRCFALARRFGAPPVEPGPLGPVVPREPSWEQLAIDTLIEGCVGETVAALIAERAGPGTVCPAVRHTLQRIAIDEASHAASSWRILHWALARGGETVESAIRSAVASIRPSGGRESAPEVDDPDARDLRRYGRLDAAERRRALRDAWNDIIDPLLDSLLGDVGATVGAGRPSRADPRRAPTPGSPA